MKNDEQVAAAPPPTARLYWGVAFLLVFNIATPFLGVPLVAITNLSVETKTLISGVCIAVGELSLPVAIAILGKPGFAFLKSLVFRRMKSFAPPSEVSPTRYRIGLIMFVIPLIIAWLEPYVRGHIGVIANNRLEFALAGDALLIASLFVLGGNFWDKIRALFVHNSVAQFDSTTVDGSGQ
mgnify:CR=1 FL=1